MSQVGDEGHSSPTTPDTALYKHSDRFFLPKTITATKNNAEKVSALLPRCSLEMSGWRGAGPNLQVSDLTRWQSNHITHTAATALKKPRRSCWWHIRLPAPAIQLEHTAGRDAAEGLWLALPYRAFL